jgi:hypothetical protein
MNASTPVICRDEIDPRLFEYPARMPITLAQEIPSRMEQYPAVTVRLKAEGSHWRRSGLS